MNRTSAAPDRGLEARRLSEGIRMRKGTDPARIPQRTAKAVRSPKPPVLNGLLNK
jgi:hypothetical protein